MKIIVCLDDKDGMLFHNRRQTKDRAMLKDMKEMVGLQKLYVNDFSASLFSTEDNIIIKDNPLNEAGINDYCLIENLLIGPYKEQIDEIIVYRWNRIYPADQRLDISLKDSKWKLKNRSEFQGFSHEKITKEVYKK